MSLLLLVLVVGLIIGLTGLSYHTLWRGSSRTLYSVQEHRQLINLARSALDEAYYVIQARLDHGQADWFGWLTRSAAVPPRTHDPRVLV